MAHSALRTVTTIAAATALSAVALTSGHAAQADPSTAWSSAADSAARSQVVAGPRGYDNDPDFFFWYESLDSSSDCGGNPTCDITYSSFSISRDYPEDLVALLRTAGPTDSEMSNNDTGGVVLYIDSDSDASDWDYRLWSAYESFPLRTAITSRVEQWDGDSWEWTDIVGSWYRTPELWLASFPWQEFDIESAYVAVRAVGAEGGDDWSPGKDGTPRIPIAAMVAGAPGQPQNPTATPTDTGDVDVTWTAPVNSGASAITSYEVTASPGGRNCTTGGLDCTITGLTPGTEYFFTVRAINAQGAGLPSDVVAATPKSLAPAMPMIKSKVKIKKTGKTASITTFWTKPAGATSFEIRWTLANKKWTPWKSTRATKATVKGIAWKTGRSFEVRALNSYGTSPADMRVLYYGPNEGR